MARPVVPECQTIPDVAVARDDDDDNGDKCNCSKCTSPKPTNQHSPFYRPDALPVAQTTVSIKALKSNTDFLFNYVLVE